MRYRKFIIRNYRGITSPLEIQIDKNTLLPIIGVNESGKTTILQAIFALDHYNDLLNDAGRHLKDVTNLVETKPGIPLISAEIELTWAEFAMILDKVEAKGTIPTEVKQNLKKYRLSPKKRSNFPGVMVITRNLQTLQYDIESAIFTNSTLNHYVAYEAFVNLPYILYFDDFRDSIEERIEIKRDADGGVSGWLSIMEQLFKYTDPSYSVFGLDKREERQRKSMLDRVKITLNATLTKEWQNFRLDDTESLSINIDYEPEVVDGQVARTYLKLDVVETDSKGFGHFFFIRDRSKGFYWFFNFVMKLEFNPKTVGAADVDAIYLLDEPGSYLHASAQSELCKKLVSLSTRNCVIYCTHSPYLLNPDVVPLNCIQVADKRGTGNIALVPIHEYKGGLESGIRSAYQPVQDALQIKPFLIDMSLQNVLITEGITDYYAFDMFRGDRAVNVFPSSGADNIRVHISNMLGWRIPFHVLWDNDDTGRAARQRAEEYFGKEIAQKCFHLLPLGSKKKRLLEDLFDDVDKQLIRNELGLTARADFKKAIVALYYAPNRADILDRVSQATCDNFSAVLSMIGVSK